MKKILIFSLLILLFSCSEKKKQVKISEVESKENWIKINDKDSIPELFSLSLKKILKNNFIIANPNENFNSTDIIINDSIPTRQLRLLLRNNNYWRMSYIQGGFGKHYVYAECKITNDSISNFKICKSILKLEDNDSIEKFIFDKKLIPKKVEIKMNSSFMTHQ